MPCRPSGLVNFQYVISPWTPATPEITAMVILIRDKSALWYSYFLFTYSRKSYQHLVLMKIVITINIKELENIFIFSSFGIFSLVFLHRIFETAHLEKKKKQYIFMRHHSETTQIVLNEKNKTSHLKLRLKLCGITFHIK